MAFTTRKRIQVIHARRQIRLGCSQVKVEMIAHQNPGEDLPATSGSNGIEQPQPILPIAITAHDSAPFPSTHRDLVQSLDDVDTQRPGHAPRLELRRFKSRLDPDLRPADLKGKYERDLPKGFREFKLESSELIPGAAGGEIVRIVHTNTSPGVSVRQLNYIVDIVKNVWGQSFIGH